MLTYVLCAAVLNSLRVGIGQDSWYAKVFHDFCDVIMLLHALSPGPIDTCAILSVPCNRVAVRQAEVLMEWHNHLFDTFFKATYSDITGELLNIFHGISNIFSFFGRKIKNITGYLFSQLY
ncbi:hypothetical protein SAMN05443144_11415 [Fodinibius roseus]|uniref:Uncharacterized protein n=2 Tax=Fodinibius roseus TaxID=1194090 RepID=A0A1M5F050_9BACT|nr:hypothetical protein SAMN05443144_11415 [Fodinibius roseus]